MKCLLLGKSGQLGQALQGPLSLLGELISLDRQAADLSNLDHLRRCVQLYRPNIIVNAAAYTAVDQAESIPEEAHLINGRAVDILATEAAKLNAWLVHYSTDYVFDGNKSTAYTETDFPAPLNVYGQSKLAGEKILQSSRCKYLLFRTSWLYSNHGKNFPLTILKRAAKGEPLTVINDAWGAPTSTCLIAKATVLALYKIFSNPTIERTAVGFYHVTASGETSWYEYAKFLIALALEKGLPLKITPEEVQAVSSDTYPSIARRPRNCRLDNHKWTKQFGLVLPDWKHGVNQLIDTLNFQRNTDENYTIANS